jgi:uracil-DNA glycosylase family 4
MPDDDDFLRKQVEGHLRSLHGAGVGWSSAAAPLQIQILGDDNTGAVTLPGSLFAAAEAATPSLPLDDRRKALKLLVDEVKGCVKCAELCSTRTQTVFGQGEFGAELCFIGEAPGADEDAQGQPFVGAAGQLLNKIIAACGLKREEVYICNILKCRPPGNRTPQPNEAANCRGFLERQIELVQPKFICALGGCAATNLLQTTASLGKLRGKFHDYRGIPVLCTYHPAYLLPHRSPEKKRDVWEDMKLLMAKMGRTIPKT